MSINQLFDASGIIENYLLLIHGGQIRTAELFVVEMSAAARRNRFARNPTKELVIYCCQDLIDAFNDEKNKNVFMRYFYKAIREYIYKALKHRLLPISEDGTVGVTDYEDIHRLIIIASGKIFSDRMNWMLSFIKMSNWMKMK